MPELVNQETTIRVFDVIGSTLGVSSDDGQKVYDQIAPLLLEGRKVKLSFENIRTIIPAFPNAAIGQLYDKFPEERIRKLLIVRDMAQHDIDLLKLVADNAKLYFKNRKQFDDAWNEEVSDRR